ncbi:MAG: alkaline phosphatase [Phycisphaeraceae bacterium]|nr:alkaline phosphatase [Phycisphaeraceae bacterium]
MTRCTPSRLLNRRQFLARSAAATGSLVLPAGCAAPFAVTSDRTRPAANWGVASGDVTQDAAIIWSRTDRPARMIVEYAATESYRNPTRIAGPVVAADTGFTGRVDLRGLPAGQQVFYRVAFSSPTDRRAVSDWITGTLRTAPDNASAIRFAFSADTAGQGFGINSQWGGMRLYETMRRSDPDFFIHSGDTIYADNPIEPTVLLDDGREWRNLVTAAKSKVAESLEEYRGNYEYNLRDEHVRRFNAQVPQLVQWDDHEVTNNWYPDEVLDDARYTVRDVNLLAARGHRAFIEYNPIRIDPSDERRIYRSFHHGPLLDVFMLDMRRYRGPNTANLQPEPGPATRFLGDEQMAWLKKELRASRAVWKVIAADMPLGLVVRDGKHAIENIANIDGSPLGREFEIAALLRFIKQEDVRNLVWVTGDVHYAAAHYYDPARAAFSDFSPFWEFVAGPIHAGTFPPKQLDNTFGPQVKFSSVPADLKPKRPPSDGRQYFGLADIDPDTRALTVTLRDLEGRELYRVELTPG